MSLIFTQVVRFLLLVVLQSLIFSFLPIYQYALGFVFIFFILFLPIHWPKYLQLILSFLIGLCIDLFTGTYGIHAILSPALLLIREPILRFILPKYNEEEWVSVNLLNRGFLEFTTYILVMSFIFCLGFYCLNFFTTKAIFQILLYALASTGFTFLLLLLYRFIIANTNQPES